MLSPNGEFGGRQEPTGPRATGAGDLWILRVGLRPVGISAQMRTRKNRAEVLGSGRGILANLLNLANKPVASSPD